ncbi:hypothetical protein BM613_06685 [Sulfoacidibacillus thermotolerans]|uniref:Uncharacterized protein n=2 Tax=Sulfoacidibacillus thermotolerans TaxID=1765684 RepID=A0A2U3D9E4_SULT2|nr:hypothetical protein BM613_06685 [Sulfoacidibacillus thermotolerans]
MLRSLRELVIIPEHAKRTETEEFRKSKERLQEDGHYRCWVCGTTERLQVHHYGIEWSLAHLADWNKVKAFCEEWDPYGYGHLLRNIPLKSPDDIRNLLVLCEPHHIGIDHRDEESGIGIHELTFPIFLIQKLSIKGIDAVPQSEETLQHAEETIKKELPEAVE